MIDDKQFLEHTELFKKRIEENLKLGLENIKSLLFDVKTKPDIYFTILEKEHKKYSFFLNPMLESNEDEVYIDKPYYELKELENKEFIGEYVLGTERFRFIFTLEKDTRYIEKIEEIYFAYLLSNLEWDGLDLRYVNRMYKIKFKEFIDIIENVEEAKIEYNLDEDFKFNQTIFWNISEEKIISKKTLTRLDDIGYKYILDKKVETFYLVKDDIRNIDDILIYDEHIDIYSRKDDLYIFDIFKILPFDKRFVTKYIDNKIVEHKLISIEDIKKIFFKQYKIKILEIFYSNENLSHLLIPDYNQQIFKFKNSYIYIKLEKIACYEDVFFLVNFLNNKFEAFEVRIYE